MRFRLSVGDKQGSTTGNFSQKSFIALLTAIVASLLGWWYLDYGMEKMFEANYLSAEEFYKKFKVFKENLNEQGPRLLTEILADHTFLDPKIKVSSFTILLQKLKIVKITC